MNGQAFDARVCACGCGASMDALRPNAIYATNACRSRAWRARVGYRLKATRKPSQNATLRPPARPRVDYLHAVDAVAFLLDRYDAFDSHHDARTALEPLLTPRGRAGATFHTREAS